MARASINGLEEALPVVASRVDGVVVVEESIILVVVLLIATRCGPPT